MGRDGTIAWRRPTAAADERLIGKRESNSFGPCQTHRVARAEIARIYVLAGENDKALENLNRSLNEGCFWLSMMKTEPIFDPLRGDPRFKDMLKKVNLSE